MVNGFGMNTTLSTMRVASFSIPVFDVIVMDVEIKAFAIGDGNLMLVIFLDLMQVISWREAEMEE
ncbi:hypothetical protein BVRB_7g158690 [Beta vulgaris subsp. vulgaris]|nr:hypothetical protein BVRB_7g158690 [Beta vulgaris subsp. vulgaris]